MAERDARPAGPVHSWTFRVAARHECSMSAAPAGRNGLGRGLTAG